MSASRHEIEYAKLDGVKYLETKKVKEDGEEKLITLENSEGLFEADSTIVATSQGLKPNIASHTKGIEKNKFGLVTTDQCGRTTREDVFASGDVVTAAKTVVEAVNFSKKVADVIDEYVSEKYGSTN